MNRNHLADALRTTADRLADGARYEWGHVGRCNCGHLAQTLTARDGAEIFRLFGQELTEWSEHARGRCAVSNHDLEELFGELYRAGLSRDDLRHLEYLSDPEVLAFLPDGRRDLRRNDRDDVVAYMRAMAARFEAMVTAA